MSRTALEHIPSGNFSANSAWMCCAVLAHNLIRWTLILGEPQRPEQLTVATTVRTQLIALPGRLVNRSGTITLRMPTYWPWAEHFTATLATLRVVQPAARIIGGGKAPRQPHQALTIHPQTHAGLINNAPCHTKCETDRQRHRQHAPAATRTALPITNRCIQVKPERGPATCGKPVTLFCAKG